MNIVFFEQRKVIARNLLSFIRLKGYSKKSFSILTGISRPTIDQILKAESPNPTTFNAQIAKINETFNLPADYFITTQEVSTEPLPLAYAYLDHGIGEERSEQVKVLLEGLDNVLDIYSMYV